MPVPLSRASSVIVHRVPPAAADRFLALQEELTREAEAFPGYRGTDVYPPADAAADEWVVLIHFVDAAALRGWLDAPVRDAWVMRVRKEVGEFRLQALPAGFGAWFTRPDAAPPPGWKMVFLVLLGLYPTVMLLTLTVGRITNPLGLAAAMLIGNALSVSLLQYAVMPLLTRAFGPWPAPPCRRCSDGGAVVALLAGLTALFRLGTG